MGVEKLLDEGSWEVAEDGLRSRNPIGWPDYDDALTKAAHNSGWEESVRAGAAHIGGHPVEYAEFGFGFIGGSMGEVAGERLARSMERAAAREVPFVLRTATGGARMQEGMRSLVQMPKLVTTRIALAEARVPFIAVLGHPTTGGVLASLGGLADATIAESGATIGFAGPRVAEHFMGRKLGDSHTAESAFAKGLVDEVADGNELRETLINALAAFAPDTPEKVSPPLESDEETPEPEDAWSVVARARSEDRPFAHELLLEMTESLFTLQGDRAGGTDPAIDVAIGRVHGRRALFLATDRRRAPGPAAYRTARRALDLAERLGIPAVSFVDTRGADPSEESEARGIAWEIAELFQRMLSLNVPVIAIVTGEGGSGGALAFATGDVLLAYRDSFFSVIGPELAAEILWRDAMRGPEAAGLLRLTAQDLVDLGIADGLLPEPPDPLTLKGVIAYHLARLQDRGDLVTSRAGRWRNALGNREAST